MKPLDALNTLIVSGMLVGTTWRGFQHRKEYWTRRSWIGFGFALLIAFSLIAFGLFFSASVGEPWTGARGSNTRGAWIVATLLSLFGGAGGTTLLVTWLASGDPERQFPLFGSTRGKELDAGSAEPILGQAPKVTPGNSP